MAGLPGVRNGALTQARFGTLWSLIGRRAAPRSDVRERLLAVLLVGLAVRLALIPAGGFPIDISAKQTWVVRLLNQSPSDFYRSPDAAGIAPGEAWLLWIVGNLYHLVWPEQLVGGGAFTLLVKLVPLAADIGIALLLFALGRRLVSPSAGIWAAAAYVLNPAAIFATSIWGSWWSVAPAAALAAAWLLLRGKVVAAGPVLTAAVLLQPSLLALVPFFVAVWLWRSVLPRLRYVPAEPGTEGSSSWLGNLKRGAAAVGTSLLVAGTVLLPFSIGVPPMPTRWTVAERLGGWLAGDGYANVNAFGLWWAMVGNWAPDTRRFLGLSFHAWGLLLLTGALAIIAIRFRRGRWADGRALVWAALAVSLALFVLPTGVHERDFFPVVPFAALGAATIPRLRWPFVALSATCLTNLAFAYDAYADLPSPGFLQSNAFGVAAGLVNAAVLVIILSRAFPAPRGVAEAAAAAHQLPLWPAGVLSTRPPAVITRRAIRVQALALPLLLFALGLAVRLPYLDQPDGIYFDEIYFVTTAQGYATGNGDAHINYVDAPYGSAYEWTHPPTGKILIATGILLFGDGPFGWRIMEALFGAAGIVVAYRLGLAVSGRQRVGLLAAGLLLVDGLYLVMSRIGTVDIFTTVFTMGALLALHQFLTAPPDRVRVPLLWTGLLLGLAISTKWNAAYAAGVVGLVVLWRSARVAWRWWQARGGPESTATWAALKVHLIWVPVGMAVVPVGVYLLSYVPFFLTGHTLRQMVDLQEAMFRYHAGIVPSHVYRSRWWEWPLGLGRMWFFSDRSTGDVRSVYVNGNPVLFLTFVPAALWVTWRWWRQRNPALPLLLAGFFGVWLPWAISPRAESFVYHFLPAVPAGCLALAVVLDAGWSAGRWRALLSGGFVVLAVAVFAFLYPLQTAQPLSEERVSMRTDIDDWWRNLVVDGQPR